jgi:tetratricopeptide (TPR) repeat protein/tRNA A-37 threonylcarbamoyl transferase component Bud32
MRSSSTPLPGTPYKKGDFIGKKYEVHDVLGKGGFGIVYLVYSHETKWVYALKTFRDEYLEDTAARERFRKEAQVWVDLERHPYLVGASFVDEVNGRLYIAMDHIAPDEQGLNTLQGYLEQKPPDLAQSLRWSIQFCYGMEYACSRSIRAHRDIKPANIMIAQDKTVKITDFGLAGVLSISRALTGFKPSGEQGRFGLSGQTIEGTGFGTPEYMPPEQFVNAAGCDQRSDVYSFGITLYQMISGGRLPFTAPERTFSAWHKAHVESAVLDTGSPLSNVVRKCLEKEPARRYATFSALRAELEPLLRSQTGEVVKPTELKALEAWEWCNKGVSLKNLGRHEEAIHCYDRALEIDPRYRTAWCNKGSALDDLGRHEEAIHCYDRALEIDPRYRTAWCNKGNALDDLGRHEEAIHCYDRALEIDQRFATAWSNKGVSLDALGRYEEAIPCYDRALEIDPRYTYAWFNKGNGLRILNRHEEAVCCFDRALGIDPRFAGAWCNKGVSLKRLRRYEEAIHCYDRALEIDPRDVIAWCDKGYCLRDLGRYEDAIRCFDRALEIGPRDDFVWYNKGLCLNGLGRHEEAVHCYDRALEIDPRDVRGWSGKGDSLGRLGRNEEAIRSYDRALEIDPRYTYAWFGKGHSLCRVDRREEAVRCYDRALEIDARHSLFWYNFKGKPLNRPGQYEKAISCYDRALEVDPRRALAWYSRALAEELLGRKQDAVCSYRQFLALASAEDTEQVKYARKRLRVLEGK